MNGSQHSQAMPKPPELLGQLFLPFLDLLPECLNELFGFGILLHQVLFDRGSFAGPVAALIALHEQSCDKTSVLNTLEAMRNHTCQVRPPDSTQPA